MLNNHPAFCGNNSIKTKILQQLYLQEALVPDLILYKKMFLYVH